MNKRILKLFNEAGFHQPEMERLGIEDKFDRFARSIIEDCVRIADTERPNNLGCGYITKTKGMLIKEYFGVEE